ncbi:alpha-L-fucosidase [Catenulispora sp. MAP12-49]|uniref:alpha-L-fucosidase n=1 Tax=Catenulispora sp. MAP12-49 TaxID=3156302 RepID=UPI0035189F1E
MTAGRAESSDLLGCYLFTCWTHAEYNYGFQDGRPWESCVTLVGDQWGHRPGAAMMSLRECVHALVTTAVGDGNLLLNVGPDADGVIEERQRTRLAEIGSWLGRYGFTVRGTRGYQVRGADWGGVTQNAGALYVHVLNWPDSPLRVPADPAWDGKAAVLTGGTATVTRGDGHLIIDVPEPDRHPLDTIIMLNRIHPSTPS